MTAFASIAFFARHEARLAIRDAAAMVSGGRRKNRMPAVWLALFLLFLHGVAFVALPALEGPLSEGRSGMVVVTAALVFAFALMLAQALESVTRTLYARGDLDLVLSSPARPGALFALRTGLLAFGTAGMAALLIGPFINVMALVHGPAWLMAYGVVLALGAGATAVAIGATLALFELLGPSRTRLVAQVVAAVIGAGFVVAAQAAAILGQGTYSRFSIFRSAGVADRLPAPDSPAWWPALAASGDPLALAALLGLSLALLSVAVVTAGRVLPGQAIRAAGVPATRPGAHRRSARFRARTAAGALRHKELVLIARDPWLVSQTLMQILYLLPPALMLWKSFGADVGTAALMVPVIVMGAGQLAGGIAWLTLSGEDAPDLIATAPVSAGTAIRAKVEAVLIAVALPLAPLVLGLAIASPFVAAVGVAGSAAAAAGATAIQFLFRGGSGGASSGDGRPRRGSRPSPKPSPRCPGRERRALRRSGRRSRRRPP